MFTPTDIYLNAFAYVLAEIVVLFLKLVIYRAGKA